MLSTDAALDRIEQIIGFVRLYAPQAHLGSDDYMRREVLWHSAHDRVDLLWNENRLAGVFLWMVLNTLDDIKHNRFPTDDPRGAYFYVVLGVMHPLYRSRTLLWRLLHQKREEFPNLQYLYYYDADNHYRPRLVPLPPKGVST